MKKKSAFLVIFFVLVLLPVWALAGSVQGSIQGYNCVTAGKVCPIGKEDPVIALERVFVVLTKGGEYYFVPNLDRALLARHINQEVRLTGKVDQKFKSIHAVKLDVMQKGAWRTTWSLEMQRELAQDLLGGSSLF